MKMLFIYLSLFSMLTLCWKCEESYPIYLKNNATHPIGLYFATGGKYGTYYPDSLPETNEYVIYNLGIEERYIYDSGISWEEIFKNSLPKDTLSVFVFHSDTLQQYSWKEIKKNYKILKRYDLSLEDLKQLDWEITYSQ